VSQESLEIVRRFYQLWNARDSKRLAALFYPDAVTYPPEGWPEGSPFYGHKAISAGVCTLLEGFGDATISLEDSAAHEDWVVTRHRALAHGDHSGLVAEFHNSAAFRVRGSKIVEARFYWDHVDALSAAGLEE
jgi:ketosteroid isomerase-like protein